MLDPVQISPVTRLERFIATIPTRSAQASIEVFTRLVGRLLEARDFPRAEDVEGELARLQPVLHRAIVMHAPEHQPIEVAMPDCTVAVFFLYANAAGEDITLPPVVGYGPLGSDVQVDVRVPVAGGTEGTKTPAVELPFLRVILVPVVIPGVERSQDNPSGAPVPDQRSDGQNTSGVEPRKGAE